MNILARGRYVLCANHGLPDIVRAGRRGRAGQGNSSEPRDIFRHAPCRPWLGCHPDRRDIGCFRKSDTRRRRHAGSGTRSADPYSQRHFRNGAKRMFTNKGLLWRGALFCLIVTLISVSRLKAETPPAPESTSSPTMPIAADQPVSPNTITCYSQTGQRNHCDADTSAGVALMRSTGSGACLLGKTWGYDDTGVWVSDNCGGEFELGQSEAKARPAAEPGSSSWRAAGHRDVGRVRSRRRLPGRQGEGRVAVHQRLRADSLHRPDARHADVHGPSGYRALGGRPQRPVPAPHHGLHEGLARAIRNSFTTSSSGP